MGLIVITVEPFFICVGKKVFIYYVKKTNRHIKKTDGSYIIGGKNISFFNFLEKKKNTFFPIFFSFYDFSSRKK